MSMPAPLGGFRLVFLPEIDSTNLEVRRRALAGELPGLAVTAACQTGGLGRQGRSWVSPAGNLYISVLVRPLIEVAQIGQLAFTAAVAVADTLNHCMDKKRAQLKWPNDILIDNA
jgi:BirA family biotin operon repressor/biotin-[acetyl-CoA-carboxylase] ligase